MKESRSATDINEATKYKIIYHSSQTTIQQGATLNKPASLCFTEREYAIKVCELLRTPESDLVKELHVDPSSVELFKVYTNSTRMIPD